MHTQTIQRCRFLLTTLASSPSILAVYSPLLVGLSLVGVAAPFATGRLIDTLAYRQPFYTPFAVLAALLLAKALLTPLLDRFICTRARKIETELQLRVLDATTNLSPSRLAAVPAGEIVAKMTRDTYAVGGFIRSLYPRLVQAIVMMFAAGFALHSRSAVLGLAFAGFFPLVILGFAPLAQKFSANAHLVRKQSDSSFNTLFDFLMTLPLLRTLAAERRFVDAPQAALNGLKAGNMATDALSACFGFFLGLLLVGGEIIVLGIAGSLAAKGTIPVGDVVLYQMLFIAAIQSVQGVVALLPELTALREGIDSLGEAFAHRPPERPRGPLAPFESLTFSHVTFAYPHADAQPAIRDFTATFRAGSVVGLSGANGAGKSTLLKLAIGALEPQAGEILFNGRPLDKINTALFRLRIGLVSQDNILIAGSIRDNITLRDPGIGQSDIDRALALSGFDAVVKRLPDGLDTTVGNQLRTLSGGERQRLAIARAIIRDPMILILDEATNHLDSESRKIVAKLVGNLKFGRLIFIAGHDSELEKACDVKISCQIPENGSYISV